ncbi:MAG: lytic murein transglycosylase B [Gammaproteobacteria bacterium]|jgi:membrane-bound lytic murein transglycosylase B|nr:lytic murein transglycosylase B [Gammaproteobacteria bacterium]
MQVRVLKSGLLATLLLTALAINTTAVTATRSSNYNDQPQVQAFIDRMVDNHDYNRDELVAVLNEAQRRDDILELMSKPAEKRLHWFEYRKIFLTQSRIMGGVAFWEANVDILEKAGTEFGVDPQVIVAIIGVETRYGGNTGRHRVLDALSTLAFDYPPRSEFFTSELEQYLLLAREEDIDLVATTGSYAGAMGYGQFIPSSYRNYAVDFDKDGKRDLMNNKMDIIGSVANYFQKHGWSPGTPVATRATIEGDDYQTVLDLGYEPNTVLDAMRHDGITPVTPLPDDLLAALIRFEQEDGPEYWLGFKNFYVITRYNHSPLYAMAVYQLSEEIRAAYEQSKQ